MSKNINEFIEQCRYTSYAGQLYFNDWLKVFRGYSDENDIREYNDNYSGIEELINSIYNDFWEYCKNNNIYGYTS